MKETFNLQKTTKTTEQAVEQGGSGFEDNLQFSDEDDRSKVLSNREAEFYPSDEEIGKKVLETPISEHNSGYQLLLKMGWRGFGVGLGKDSQGRVDPIPFQTNQFKLGVGKESEENYYHLEATKNRKKLHTEVLANESLPQRKLREEKVKLDLEVAKEVKLSQLNFYCSLCNKQYASTSQFQIHLDSYDHNHKKRFKEMNSEFKNLKKRRKTPKQLDPTPPEITVEAGNSGMQVVPNNTHLNEKEPNQQVSCWNPVSKPKQGTNLTSLPPLDLNLNGGWVNHEQGAVSTQVPQSEREFTTTGWATLPLPPPPITAVQPDVMLSSSTTTSNWSTLVPTTSLTQPTMTPTTTSNWSSLPPTNNYPTKTNLPTNPTDSTNYLSTQGKPKFKFTFKKL